MFDITTYRLLVYANSTDEVTFRPNTVSAPIDIFEKWELGLQATSGIGFDEPNDFPNRPLRWNRDQQMDVIQVSVDLLEQEIGVVIFDVLDSSQQEGLDAFVDDLTSVFGRKHNVVVTGKNAVRLSTVDGWHSSMIHGYYAQELGSQAAGTSFIPRPYGRGIAAEGLKRYYSANNSG